VPEHANTSSKKVRANTQHPTVSLSSPPPRKRSLDKSKSRDPPKFLKPETFDGTPKSLNVFIQQLHAYFDKHEDYFTNENDQVLFIGSLLTKSAKSWYTSLQEEHDPSLRDLNSFMLKLNNDFADKNIVYKNRKILKSCVQGRFTVSEHIIYFRGVANKTDFDTQTKIAQFVRSLN
jgi:hypothetical protein